METKANEFRRGLVVIGGGVGGMAAAVAAFDAGVEDIVILETAERLGGVLGQCIHSGFGLHTFGEELTGPEFSARFEKMVADRGIDVWFGTPVTALARDGNGLHVSAISEKYGEFTITAGAVVLATGCRERPAGALKMSGPRPAGVMTAGTAQKYINIYGCKVGSRAIILGSGDIGLIMARRLTLEGAKVLAVCELMPYSNGLNRNIVQCLNDFDIPLRLSTTVVGVEGEERLEGVWLAPVSPDTLKPETDKREFVPCDTLLLSVGLIPETALLTDAGGSLGKNNGVLVDDGCQSDIEGVFACGNVVQVHDLVDFVADEGARAGKAAAGYALDGSDKPAGEAAVEAGAGVGYVVPELIRLPSDKASLSMRVKKVFKNAKIVVRSGDRVLASRRRPIMAPGEMEHIDLRPDIQSGETLTVEISEKEELE